MVACYVAARHGTFTMHTHILCSPAVAQLEYTSLVVGMTLEDE